MMIAIVFDEEYRTEGSYAYDTDAETREAEREERAKLDSGEWAVYGVISYQPCDNPAHTCRCPHVRTESVWGTVTDAGHDGTYDRPEDIRHEYLRSVATDLTPTPETLTNEER